MEINPVSKRGSVPITESDVGFSPSEVTAAKVSQFKPPVVSQKGGLRDRNVTILKEATDLSNAIKKDWDELAPEDLAERIIELEDRVSLLKESSPAIDKIKKQAEHLHFKFVFPIVLEIETSPSESAMPVSFARNIYKAANEILKKNSAASFNQLSSTQKREVIRYALKGGV